MANVDAASKDAVLVPDVKAFQKSLHLNAGAFHVFQFALKGFLMMSVPNQQMPQVTTRSMPKRSSNISQSGKWGGSIKQRSTSSWLDSIQREIWDGWRKSPQESPRYPHKSSQSHIPTGRGFSIVHFETFRRGLVRFRWWEYSHRSHRPV